MSPTARESSHEVLSVFADGECTEFECRQVVRDLVEDEALRRKLERYELIGAVLREEHVLQVDPAFADRVMARIRPFESGPESEAAAHHVPSGWRSRYWRPAAGLAVAATVAVVTVLGVRALTTAERPVQMAAQSTAGAVEVPAKEEGTGARTEPSWEGSPELTDYLVHHAEFAPMRGTLPYARVVGYETSAR
ncbi:MAG TPA: hypothetical protein ENK62_02305 [Chromatiales bacterium]|nr:hypothetical protein [Chromatiales bacterium]